MRDSILYSSIRALFVAFCVVIGLSLGIIFISVLLGMSSSSTPENKLNTVYTEEILPNADGKREMLASNVPVILQVNINGIIGLDELDTQTVQKKLVESREGVLANNRVKALLLHINTPGGTVFDADGIFNAIMAYKHKYNTPVYAYVDGLCASGGMYVALAADKVFASDTSLIGSVGVIAPAFFNVTKLMEKIGVDALVISAGKDKDALNPVRPWKDGEDENYRNIVDYYYNHFVNLVTTHRPKISKEALVQQYGAQVFPAPEAVKIGFIDQTVDSVADAMRALLTEVGITTDQYQVVNLENKNWWRSLFGDKMSAPLGTIQHKVSFSPQIDVLLSNQYLYLYTH